GTAWSLDDGSGEDWRSAGERAGEVRDLVLRAVGEGGPVSDCQRRAPGVRAENVVEPVPGAVTPRCVPGHVCVLARHHREPEAVGCGVLNIPGEAEAERIVGGDRRGGSQLPADVRDQRGPAYGEPGHATGVAEEADCAVELVVSQPAHVVQIQRV